MCSPARRYPAVARTGTSPADQGNANPNGSCRTDDDHCDLWSVFNLAHERLNKAGFMPAPSMVAAEASGPYKASSRACG
jgi:hypothetical protein